MLFRAAVLEQIRSGEVTRAFRYWRKPTVKAGGTLCTPAGVLAIDAVEVCSPRDITDLDGRAAGFGGRTALLASLDGSRGGVLYRIRFHVAGEDPRRALKARHRVSSSEFDDIRKALARMDNASGPWTCRVLRLIAENGGVSAGWIADAIGVEKAALKRNVRKLKELGLTESLTRGYRLSPRGKAVLARLDERTAHGVLDAGLHRRDESES